jgi:hypothetical protein
MIRIISIFLALGMIVVSIYEIRAYIKKQEYLREALGITQLPETLRDAHIQHRIFIDRVIRSDFKIAPTDLQKLLQVRQYTGTMDTSLLKRLPDGMSKNIDFAVGSIYEWHAGLSNCLVIVDITDSKVVVIYFNRFG